MQIILQHLSRVCIPQFDSPIQSRRYFVASRREGDSPGQTCASMECLLCCSLPSAIGMAVLSVGVSRVKAQLSNPIYCLWSNLNSATVGIIAVTAVQLARNTMKDRLSCIMVISGACAGLCYSALWYQPKPLFIQYIMQRSISLLICRNHILDTFLKTHPAFSSHFLQELFCSTVRNSS
jgi:hypothetical protein